MAALRVAPVLDMKGNAVFLDRLKVFSVSGHQWQAQPDGNCGNQTIGLDDGCLQIVGGSRRNLFVLIQPEQGFL